MQTPYKACPKCGQPADLTSSQCQRCGHRYRTQFTLPSNKVPVIDAENMVSADIVETKELRITDDTGQPRAVITTTESDGVGLVLLDENGKQRAEFLHTIGQQSAIQFKAADGTLR